MVEVEDMAGIGLGTSGAIAGFSDVHKYHTRAMMIARNNRSFFTHGSCCRLQSSLPSLRDSQAGFSGVNVLFHATPKSLWLRGCTFCFCQSG